MQNFGYSFLIFTAFIFTVFPAADHYLTRIKLIDPYLVASKKINTIIPQVVQDLKQIEKNPVFKDFHYSNNADTLLRKKIGWTGVSESEISDFNRKKLIEFATKYKDWRKNEDLFKNMVSDPEIHQIDTNWVKELPIFDHWNLSANENMNRLLKAASVSETAEKLEIFHKMPIPDFFELRSWALIHLIKEFKNVETAKGLEIWRHISYLSYTTGTLVGGQLSAQMLSDERILTDRLGFDNWQHKNDKSIQAFKRLTYIWPAIIKSTVAENMSVELHDYISPEYGICTAVFDASNTLRFRDLLEPRFILESAHNNNIERFEKTYNLVKDVCKTNQYSVFSNRAPSSIESKVASDDFNLKKFDFNSSIESFRKNINIADIPYIRRIYAALSNESRNEIKIRYYEQPDLDK